MKYKNLYPPFLIFFLFILTLPLSAESTDAMKKVFQEAPVSVSEDPLPLKSVPLWHTNSLLTPDLIHEMIFKGKESGFAGYAFLPVDSTLPKYLSEEYVKAYGLMLDEAKRAGMKIVFYDDIGFPSGTAGGELRRQHPEAMMKRLDKYEWNVEGPASLYAEIPVPLTEQVVYGEEGGILQAAVAMNVDTKERLNIRESVVNGVLSWRVPEGNWKVMAFVCVPDSRDFVDYLSSDAVRSLMSLTYDQFDQRFPGAFGSIIPMTFFDDIMSKTAFGDRSWTPGFNDLYRELYGHDPDLDYPALFYSIGDETPSARCRLWTTHNRLFAESYPRLAHEWCQKRNTLSSGHPQGPYTIGPLDMCGDGILTHRWSDVPLFDAIHYYGHGRDGFKVTTSAAENFDKGTVAVEVYGDFRKNSFDTSMMYRTVMEIFARGGNFILPHGAWSDPDNCYIEPVIGWQNPIIKDDLPAYGDWISRCSFLLRHGRAVEDIAILYPIDSLKAGFHFQYDFLTGYPIKGDFPMGLFVPEETDYLAVGADLTGKIYRDFLFLHPETFNGKCTIEVQGNETFLRLNNERDYKEFKLIVLTGSDVISNANMQKILEFYRAGGKVLATTRLPSRSAEGDFDNEVCAAVQEIFGVDPATQVFQESLRTGQEDIVLPESFRKVREMNKAGFYRREPKNPILYEEPIIQKTEEGAAAVFVPRPTPEALHSAVDLLLPNPDVDLIPDEGTALPVLNVTPRWDYPVEGMCQYLHKVKDGRDIYYIANSSNEAAFFTLKLRGTFTKLEKWNPHTGTIELLPASEIKTEIINGVNYTEIPLSLESINDIFIVGQK